MNVGWALLAWLALSIVLVASGALAALSFPFPQLLIVALSAGLILLHLRNAAFRSEAEAVSIAAILAVHATRLPIGAEFLRLCDRGELAPAFGIPAGWGDVAVGLLATLLLALPTLRSSAGTPWVQGWNVLGLVDILVVVATAARVGFGDPQSLAPLVVLPLGLLPPFLVPLIIYTHFAVMRRRQGAQT